MNIISGNQLAKLRSDNLVCKLILLDSTVEIWEAPLIGPAMGIFMLESADKKIELQGGVDMSMSFALIISTLTRAYVELVQEQIKMAKKTDGLRTDH